MGGEEPGEDRSTPRDNSMIQKILSEKGGHGTSFFFDSAIPPHPPLAKGGWGDLRGHFPRNPINRINLRGNL
jgi:hypothetical protein